MSTELATLALAVDSSQVRGATKDLTGFTAAAKPAAEAAKSVTTSLSGAASAAATEVSALNAGAQAATGLTAAHKNLDTHSMAAGHSIRSFGEAMLNGSSLSTALGQQIGHISYAMSGEGGLAGAFKAAAGAMLGFITPTIAVAGSIAAIGLGGIAAASNWTGTQHAVQLGLMGIGRASQVTVGDINSVADATSSLNGLSVSQARETATTLATTGKIGLDSIAVLTAQTKNFAAIMGTDVPKAAEAMAKIFANPTEGAKTLAATIGGIDSETVKYVETLEQQGNRQAAIKVLIDTTTPAIAKAAEQTGALASGWNLIGNIASNAYTAIGKALAGTKDQQSESALEMQRKDLEALIQTYSEFDDFDAGPYVKQLGDINDALMKIQATRKAGLATDTAQTTLQVSPIVSSLVPATDSVRGLSATVDLLSKAMTDPAFEAFRAKMGDDLPLALARAKGTLEAFIGPMQAADPWKNQIASLTIQNQLLTNNSPAMRRAVADQLAYNAALRGGAGDADARKIGAAAGAQAYGGTATDIQQKQQQIGLLGSLATAEQAVRSATLARQAAALQGVRITDTQAASLRTLALEQANGVAAIKASTDAQNVEAGAVGLSAGATAAYTAEQNALNAAKQKGTSLSPASLASIHAEATTLGQAAANADLLKFAYSGLVQGPMQTFQQQIAQGASAWTAFKAAGVSALNSLSSKLMDMAAQNLWKNALGGGSGLLSLFGLGGDTSGAVNANGSISGAIGPTSVGGAPLVGYASGTDSAPGGLARINEQGGEIVNLPSGAQVIPHDISAAMAARVAAPSGGDGNGGTVHAPVNININIDATGADPAGLARVQQQLAQLKAELPARVVAAVTTARKQRQL